MSFVEVAGMAPNLAKSRHPIAKSRQPVGLTSVEMGL
jgi:hypothetical protein